MRVFLLEVEVYKEVIELRGLREDGSYIEIQVKDYRPWFYVKHEALSAEAITKLEADLGNGIRIANVKKQQFFGYTPESESLLRVEYNLNSAPAKIVEDIVSNKISTHIIEDGLNSWRRFFIDANLAGGAWFHVSDVHWRTPNQGICPFAALTGLAPDIMDENDKEAQLIPSMRIAYFRVLTKSGRSDSWRPNSACADRIRLVACESRLNSTIQNSVVFAVDGSRTEAAVIKAFELWVQRVDPDVIIFFDNRALGLLATRAEAVLGKPLRLDRRTHYHSSAGVRVRSITTYSKDWIRSRSDRRMASANNLETHRVVSGTRGRLCLDALRFLLMRQQPKLTRYDLPEAATAILGNDHSLARLPILLPQARAHLTISQATLLVRAECQLLGTLCERLRIVPELVELARVTGLDLETVHWQAASIRTEQLLLRYSKAFGYAVPLHKAPDHFNLPWEHDTTPFLHHPAPFSELQPHQQALIKSGFMGHTTETNGSAGLYDDPIAVLDFASLYPSIFIAHNICYSTLLLDRKEVKENYHACPGGKHFFVDSGTRLGLLPRLLSGLLTKRTAAKRALRDAVARGDSAAADCLDARQLALKMCANATYGYTGSEVSSLHGKPLAEACLRWGNYYCRSAARIIHEEDSISRQVIYAQTDSMFVLLSGMNYENAVIEGRRLAEHVTKSMKIYPLRLEFERVLQPFVLVQVNRYAGVELQGSSRRLHVKGIGVDRGAPSFIRRVLRNCLVNALLQRDLSKAKSRAELAIKSLLAGHVDIDELTLGAFLWRQDHDDIKRMSLGKNLTKSDTDALKTPHVALATRLLTSEPLRTFRLGEFVPFIIAFRPNATAATQANNAEDPHIVLGRSLPVNLNLYLQNKLRPELERLFSALHIQTPTTQYRAISCPGFLATPGAAQLLGTVTEEETPRHGIRSHFGLAPASQASQAVINLSKEHYIELIAAKRQAEKHWTALLADRRHRAAYVFGADPSAHKIVADHAAPLANLIRILTDLDHKLAAFALLDDHVTPVNFKRTASPLSPSSSRRPRSLPKPRTLFPLWTCRVCTYDHYSPSEADFLSCAICGAVRKD